MKRILSTVPVLLLGALALAGCDPTYFADAEGDVAIHVFGKPATFTGKFGGQIASISGEFEGEPRSRFFVSGPDTGTVSIYEGWLDGKLRLRSVDTSALKTTASGEKGPYGLGALMSYDEGGSFCSFTSDHERKDGADRGVTVTCLGGTPNLGPIDGSSTRAAAAMAPLSHNDRMLVSDPGGEGLVVFRHEDSSNENFADSVMFDGYAPGEDFGLVLGSAKLTSSATWLAASDGETVVVLEVTGSSTFTATPVGCLAIDGAVSALVLEDVGGDGLPDLFVGTTKGLWMATGAAVASSSCGDGALAKGDEGVTKFECDAINDGDAVGACDASGPVALAFADVNGDNTRELVVGLAGATVKGKAGAGAAFVASVELSEDSLDLGDDDGGITLDGGLQVGTGPQIDMDSVAVMIAPAPSADANFGSAVAPLRTFGKDGERDELVIGASGKKNVFVYTCTGFDGDKPGSGLSRSCR
ncbi:MAG: hypothetical protein R3A78_00305 [Polyangiales bacterium]|nr:hypothetical protein [Myxococcales bacterium]